MGYSFWLSWTQTIPGIMKVPFVSLFVSLFVSSSYFLLLLLLVLVLLVVVLLLILLLLLCSSVESYYT